MTLLFNSKVKTEGGGRVQWCQQSNLIETSMNSECNVNSVVIDGVFVIEANQFCITEGSKREKLGQSPIKGVT